MAPGESHSGLRLCDAKPSANRFDNLPSITDKQHNLLITNTNRGVMDVINASTSG